MNDILKEISKPSFWVLSVIFVIILEIIGHYLFKFLNSSVKIFSEKRKYKSLEKDNDMREKAKAISDDPTRISFEIYDSLNTRLFSYLWLFFSYILFICIIGFIIIQQNVGIIISVLFLTITVFIFHYFDREVTKANRLIESAKDFYINKVDLTKIFSGIWQLTYSKDGNKETEIIEIKIGNRYLIENKLRFNLKNVEVLHEGRSIRFEKVYLNGSSHDFENLEIIDATNIEGKSSKGYSLHYKKIN